MSSYRNKKRASADEEKRQCVLYLRVSSVRQTHTAMDVDKDGNSIATQREQTTAKATEMNLIIAKEFVEPGVSAQTIEKRPVFRQMLAYVSEHPEVGYIIVYSRSRAFRNVEDAMLTRRNLRMLGVRLISTKEDFGDSIEGDAMATISDTMNELQNRLNGQDIKLKMAHKAKNGGTLSRAPIGYLNSRVDVEGRLVNSITLDSKRAPLVRMMFELYATGEYSIEALTDAMREQGLAARPTGKYRAERPLSGNSVRRVLGDPYYAGWIYYDDQLFEGRHEAIIDQDLFDRVQDVLDSRSTADVRMMQLHHYLKGYVWCERCRQAGRRGRLIYTEVKAHQYAYFGCANRPKGGCDLPYIRIAPLERAIEDHYLDLSLGDEKAGELHVALRSAVDTYQSTSRELRRNLDTELHSLGQREDRLLQGLMGGIGSPEKIRHLMNEITMQRHAIEQRIADVDIELGAGADLIAKMITLCANPHELYKYADDEARGCLNRAFFKALYIDISDGEIISVEHDIQEPFDVLVRSTPRHSSLETVTSSLNENGRPDHLGTPASGVQSLADLCSEVTSSNVFNLVGTTGLEPMTSCL